MMISKKVLVALTIWGVAGLGISTIKAGEPSAGAGKSQILIKLVLSETDGEGKEPRTICAPQMIVLPAQTATMNIGQEEVVALPDKGDAAKQTYDFGISAKVVASIGKGDVVIVSGTMDIKEHNPAEDFKSPTSARAVVRTISVPFVVELNSGTSGEIAIPPAAGSKRQLSFKLTPTVVGVENAAVYYWQAFAAVPKFDAAKTKLLSSTNEPLNLAAAQVVLGRSAEALEKLRKGAACRSCDWGLDFSKGPKLELPHLGKARELQRVALLDARVKLEQGSYAEAIQDFADVMTLARHVGADPLIINAMVMIGLEQNAIEVISPRLGDFSAENLAALSNALENLPARLPISSCVEQEGANMVKWMRAQMEESQKDKSVVDKTAWFNELFNMISPNDPKPKSNAISFDEAGMKRQIAELPDFYARLGGILKLPLEQAAARHDEFAVEMNAIRQRSPAAAMILPACKTLHEHECAAFARLEMLKTAVDILRNGDAALGKHVDPFGGGPFKFEKHGKGFTLASKMVLRKEPVMMIVNSTEKPLPKNEF